jgi:predicted aldo/keto reductase-like oxidoreductase
LLAKRNPDLEAVFNQSSEKRTPAEWALRFVWNHPGGLVVLSGMNDKSQIKENIKIASDAGPNSLSDSELQVNNSAKADIMCLTIRIFHAKPQSAQRKRLRSSS